MKALWEGTLWRILSSWISGLLLPFAITVRAADETIRYDRDEAGRLLTAFYAQDTNTAAIHYSYDANGNRLLRVDIATNDNGVNADGDDLADLVELSWFGNLRETGTTDPDGDGLVNSNELAAAGHPLRPDTDGDGQPDNDEFVAGTPLDDDQVWFRVENCAILDGGTTRVVWTGVSNRTYQVQAGSLAAGMWSNAGPAVPATENGPLWQDHFGEDAQRFYRLSVSWP